MGKTTSGQKPEPPNGEAARQADGITERVCRPEDLEELGEELGIAVLGCVPEFGQERDVAPAGERE